MGEVRGGRGGGGNGGGGRAVELSRYMRGWHTGYLHLKAVRGRWRLGLMIGWGRQIVEAGATLSLPCVHSR